MDEKELDKKLRENVEPGTESLAINEAQTQANQLLTERRMNLESEKSKMSQEAVHDTELRGAIELGAMNGNGNQQVQALPPQSAGLRPETQQLLAQYGVNPTITESSRRSNSVSQSRSSNTRSQTIPNQQGGQTRITNTTNITNITNNTTTNDTDIKGNFGNSPQVTPAPIFSPVRSDDSTGKFRTYLNNLFAKRDQERKLQEREFRKREWSLKRMNEKVLQRMERISNTFAKKMNPENIGRTFGGQLKTILAMAGLLVLPKIWPSIKSGINSIGEFLGEIKESFTSTKGGFFDKLTTSLSTGLGGLVGRIGGFIVASGEKISQSLAQLIAGKDYKPGTGITDIISDKIKEALLGKDALEDKALTLAEAIGIKFDEIKDAFSNYIDEMLDDRAKAVRKALDNSNFSILNISESIGSLGKVIAAAVGGSSALANQELSSVSLKAREELKKGTEDDDIGWFTGNVKTDHGAEVVASNMGKIARSDESSTAQIIEGIKMLKEYGEDNGIKMTLRDIFDIVNRTSPDQNDKVERMKKIYDAARDGLIQRSNVKGKSQWESVYTIPKEWVPTFLGILGGIHNYEFDKGQLRYNKSSLDNMLDSSSPEFFQLINRLDNINAGQISSRFDFLAAMENSLRAGHNYTLGALFPSLKVDYVKDYWNSHERSTLYNYKDYKNDALFYDEKSNELADKIKDKIGITQMSNSAENFANKVKGDFMNSAEMNFPTGYNYGADLYNLDNRMEDKSYNPSDDELSKFVKPESTNISIQSSSLISSGRNALGIEAKNPLTTVTDASIPMVVRPELRGEWAKDQVDRKAVSGVSSGDRLTKDQFEARVRRAMTYLIHTLGLTPTQAAGLVGNFIRESRLLTSAFNGAGGGMGARGIAQWRGSRIESFRSVNGKDVLDGSFEEQLRHVASELQSTHKSALTELKQVAEGDTAKAADIGLGRFEFSAGLNKAVEALGEHGPSSRDSGRAFAEDALNIYNSKGDFLNPINAVDDSSGVSVVDDLGLSASSSSTSVSTQSSNNDSEGMLSSLWSDFKGAVNKIFGNGDEAIEPTESAPEVTSSVDMTSSSGNLPSEMTVDKSATVTPLSEPIQFEPVNSARSIQEYIENKEDAVTEEEKSTQESTTPVIMDNSHNVGPTNINTTNNTTILVNRAKESFIESMNIKSRNY